MYLVLSIMVMMWGSPTEAIAQIHWLRGLRQAHPEVELHIHRGGETPPGGGRRRHRRRRTGVQLGSHVPRRGL